MSGLDFRVLQPDNARLTYRLNDSELNLCNYISVCSFGERFGDFCYVINETPVIYTDAHSACQEHHGNLATIKTKEQQAFIQVRFIAFMRFLLNL